MGRTDGARAPKQERNGTKTEHSRFRWGAQMGPERLLPVVAFQKSTRCRFGPPQYFWAPPRSSQCARSSACAPGSEAPPEVTGRRETATLGSGSLHKFAGWREVSHQMGCWHLVHWTWPSRTPALRQPNARSPLEKRQTGCPLWRHWARCCAMCDLCCSH